MSGVKDPYKGKFAHSVNEDILEKDGYGHSIDEEVIEEHEIQFSVTRGAYPVNHSSSKYQHE